MPISDAKPFLLRGKYEIVSSYIDYWSSSK